MHRAQIRSLLQSIKDGSLSEEALENLKHLPSVVGDLTGRPIIAVPTSTGYGTSIGGLTALFAMLNSCVPGIAVMDIDNGFGAGCLAHKINTI